MCNPIIHFTRAGNHMMRDSAQLPSWDAIICESETCSIQMASQSRGGGTSPILRQSGHLSREVILESTCVGKKKERKLCSECFIVPGHWTFWKVLGALNSCSAISTELSESAMGTCKSWCHRAWCWIWTGQKSLSFFLPLPHSWLEVGHYRLNLFHLKWLSQ